MNILAAHQKKIFFKATRMKNLNEPVLSPCRREPEINRACFKEIHQASINSHHCNKDSKGNGPYFIFIDSESLTILVILAII